MIKWLPEEIQIIKDNLHLGSKAIADLINTTHNTNRTFRAVRAKAQRLNLHIKNISKYQQIPGLEAKRKKQGKPWVTRRNNKQVTFNREGLTAHEVKLADGRVVSRSELLRLNRLGYLSQDNIEIKQAIKYIAALEEKTYILIKNNTN